MTEIPNLKKIYKFVKNRSLEFDESVWIPALWNKIGYDKIEEEKNNEICVNAYDFIASTIRYIYDSKVKSAAGLNLDNSVVYNSLARYTAAWDYNHDGKLEMGTFLRLMMLLPFLKELGVNILYLLPVTKYSTLKQKGDIGSPYAVKSYFELDRNLHEEMLDGMDNFSLDNEFTALIEACHLLGIKVIHDFIPRVTAVDSDLIKDHPDWVYWIKLEELDGFKPPEIPELGFFQECTAKNVDTIYKSKGTPRHIAKFTWSPDKLNPELWEKLKTRAEETGENLLTLVEKEMKITTAPAHSDWVNDVQPIWTDITFLRLYMDFSPLVRKYLKPDQPPYVMFDTVKCENFPGDVPNKGLWDMFEQVIRHGMEGYGLDGFRVDIGHTIPPSLLEHLFEVVKEIKPDAVLMSEDLKNENHARSAEAGYNIMLGNNWYQMSIISKENLTKYLKSLPSLKIHIFACAETADTPRIVSRHGGVKLARNMAVFNYFMPNGTPYITTGFEVNEPEPLNCGLADNTNGANIPRAFFNKMNIKWSSDDAPKMVELLEKLLKIRKQYLEFINPKNFILLDSPEDTIVYGYKKEKSVILCCLNLNMESRTIVNFKSLLPEFDKYRVLVDTDSDKEDTAAYLSKDMQPGQAVVITNV